MVLVHGTPVSALIWQPVVRRLAGRYRFRLLDLPGYGRSAKFEGQEVRLRSFARVLAEWMHALGLVDPVLVGHDFGAATVLGANLVEGFPVSAICIGDGVVLSPWGTPFSRHVKQHHQVFAAVPDHVHTATLQAHLATGMSRTPPPELVRALVEPWRGPVGQPAYYRQVAQYDEEYTDRLEPLYPQLDVPFLILWGEEDGWVDIGEGRRLAGLVPHSEFLTLPDAGHFSMLDTPGLFCQHLDRWLSRLT